MTHRPGGRMRTATNTNGRVVAAVRMTQDDADGTLRLAIAAPVTQAVPVSQAEAGHEAEPNP